MRTLMTAALTATTLLAATGCETETLEVAPEDMTKPGEGKWDTSVEALFVDMEFDGTLLASSSFNPQQTIQNQMLYTIGHLNGDRSV